MNDGWTITIGATRDDNEASDAELEELVDRLAAHGGAVSGASASFYNGVFIPTRLDVTLSIDVDEMDSRFDKVLAEFNEGKKPAPSVAFVIRAAVEEWQAALADVEMTGWNITHIDARTYPEHELELMQPVVPELVGVAELAALLKVSPQRASELRSREGFPAPTVELKSGPVWVKANVEHFASTWKRSPGRPKKAVGS